MADTGVHDAQRLKELQALPLVRKIQITQTRIIEWYLHFGGSVYVSFSGGKDSTVLLHIARQIYPDIPAVFSNTGLEYPEIQKFAKSFPNVDVVTPEMRFDKVIKTYGYPLIGKEVAEAIYYARRITTKDYTKLQRLDLSGERTANGYAEAYKEVERRRNDFEGKWQNEPRKESNGPNSLRKILKVEYERRKGKSLFCKEKWLPLARDLPVLISHYCCEKMKKSPMHKYQRNSKRYPILGTLAEESRVRKQAWIRHGCNLFDGAKASSQPMSFWTEQDVLQYIQEYGLKIASVYGEIVGEPGNLHCTGCDRTGCIFCAFGAHLEKGETRFQRLKQTHPKHYNYCIGGGEWEDNPFYDPDAPEYDGEWKNWNPKQIWTCNSKGLGMGKVFDMVNELYGKELYRY